MLGSSPQAYHAWLAAPISPRDLEDAYLINALIDAHSDDPEFGYRFLADELQRAGLVAGAGPAESSWCTPTAGRGSVPGPSARS